MATKTVVKKATKAQAKKATKKIKMPPGLAEFLKALSDGSLAPAGLKMARLKCPHCGNINLGIAWSKATNWMVLCDTCHACEHLDSIKPQDPEQFEAGDEVTIITEGNGSVN